MNKVRKVIYTALFGDYDNLIELPKFEGWDYVCFTDQKSLTSDVWKIVEVTDDENPPNILNRMYKWLPHRYLNDYEISLYIDSNVEFFKNPDYFLDTYLNDNLLAIPYHPSNCIYRESNGCVVLGKSKSQDTLDQMEAYFKDGFPENFGLSENCIIFRVHNNQKVIELMENVWDNLLTYKTKRDQLSFMYEIWKVGFKSYTLMNRKDTYDFFTRQTHKYKSNRSLYQRLIGNIKKLRARRDSKNYKIKLENLRNKSLEDK